MSNENLTFKIKGITVKIEAFHFSETYAGLLMGSPTKETNQSIISDCDYPTNWGHRNAKYNREKMYIKPNVLYPYHYSVWLTSSVTINDLEGEYFGSQVIANWFDRGIGNKGLIDFIKEGLEDFDWFKYAENYNP
jgi:hypothetical protein